MRICLFLLLGFVVFGGYDFLFKVYFEKIGVIGFFYGLFEFVFGLLFSFGFCVVK